MRLDGDGGEWVRLDQTTLELHSRGRGSYDITDEVAACVSSAGVVTGLCQVFLQHTSASLMLCENADPQVRTDLETFMADLAPDGDRRLRHRTEGPDDMPAHIRAILTGASVQVPVARGRLALGTWQGIYLWEHRTGAYRRRAVVTVWGE